MKGFINVSLFRRFYEYFWIFAEHGKTAISVDRFLFKFLKSHFWFLFAETIEERRGKGVGCSFFPFCVGLLGGVPAESELHVLFFFLNLWQEDHLLVLLAGWKMFNDWAQVIIFVLNKLQYLNNLTITFKFLFVFQNNMDDSLSKLFFRHVVPFILHFRELWVHPDKGIKEGVKSNHISCYPKGSKFTKEELKPLKYFQQIIEDMLAFDVGKVIQRGDILMIIDKHHHLFLWVRFDPEPLRLDQTKVVLFTPLEELEILSESMCR